MTIIHDTQTINVADLDMAYQEASNFITYDGNDNYKMFWLLTYYQLKSLRGYVADNKKAIDRFTQKESKIELEYDSNFNDSRFRNICFVGGGNLSKSSGKYKLRMRNKIGRLAENSCRNKVISTLLEFTNTNLCFNGRDMMNAVGEFNSNKDLSDDFNYEIAFNTPLAQVHQIALLWLSKYAPQYVTDCIGSYLGSYWKNRQQ